MANQNNVVWITPPDKMAQAIEQYGERALVAVVAVAEFMATKIQNEARQNAPWENPTGHARSGLFGLAKKEDQDSAGRFLALAERAVVIYLSHGHTIFYGKFLKLSHGGTYAIIMPTIERNLPELKRMLDEIFR